ncbi:MAG: D-inositol-3-phosphate glycosyltransferase [Syntrophus sp. SKADARSKE-3]|nr:D-inositol-3-phosphate glycosyltransferase [Syntrophus sp. SKADARSKE-3]
MKTRILFVIDGLEFGGGERVFAQIISGLPKNRYEAYLACAPNDAFQKAIGGAAIRFFPMDFSNRYNFTNLRTLMRIIKKEKIDIVHGQGARAEFYARLAAGFSGRKKCLSTLAMPVEGYDVGSMKKSLYKAMDSFSERFVDRFLVVSDVLVKTMIEGHGIAKEKVIKIYNGIETDHYSSEALEEQRQRIRQEFFIGDTEFLIGAVGRLVWQKGFEYYLQAIPKIHEAIPNACFILVGDGPLRKDLENQAKSLGIDKQIIFTGQRNDIRNMMAAMDVIVIPSLLEGFPMVTLEAMAMEKPIVATVIDGITEQITDGVEGILTPPRDPHALAQAIMSLAKDRERNRVLGNAARKRVVRDFSVKTMIEATLTVYEDLE